eukprot:15341948-Ditylum_brightwellii.AAC.2
MDQMKKMSWIILTVIPCIWRNDDYFDYGHEEDLSSSHWERMQQPPELQLLQRWNHLIEDTFGDEEVLMPVACSSCSGRWKCSSIVVTWRPSSASEQSMDPEAMLRIAKMNMRNCTELLVSLEKSRDPHPVVVWVEPMVSALMQKRHPHVANLPGGLCSTSLSTHPSEYYIIFGVSFIRSLSIWM